MFGVGAKLYQHALGVSTLWLILFTAQRQACLAEAGAGVLVTVFHVSLFDIYTFETVKGFVDVYMYMVCRFTSQVWLRVFDRWFS